MSLKKKYNLLTIEKINLGKIESAALSGNLEELEHFTRHTNQSADYHEIVKKVIASKQTEAAKMLINRGWNLSKSGLYIDEKMFYIGHENQVLHLAITSGNLELVQFLLTKNICPETSDRDGSPPLFKILDFPYTDSEYSQILDALLQKGARINITLDGFTILHSAAQKGNTRIIPFLIQRKCRINAQSVEGLTALHIAVKNRHFDVVTILLKYNAHVALHDDNGSTPLSLAIENNDFAMFKTLLFACIRTSKEYLSHDASLVYLAIAAQNVEMIKLLLSKGLTVNSASIKTGQSALNLAIEKGSLEILEILLNYGVDLKTVDSEGFTPLHFACSKGNASVSALLKTKKCDLGARSNTGLTALHAAVIVGHSEVVSLLLQRGADLKAVDHKNRTPLSFALEASGDPKTLEVLLKHRRTEKESETFLEDQLLMDYHSKSRDDSKKNSALHLAVLAEDESGVILLLKLQACIDALNGDGHTPLDLATIKGSISIVSHLLQSRNESWFAPKEDGYTPLHIAAENGNTRLLELFFKAGIPIRCKQKTPTVLHIACRNGDKELILLLLRNGAKIDATGGNDFETPIFTAASHGNMEALEVLLEMSSNKVFLEMSCNEKNDSSSQEMDASSCSELDASSCYEMDASSCNEMDASCNKMDASCNKMDASCNKMDASCNKMDASSDNETDSNEMDVSSPIEKKVSFSVGNLKEKSSEEDLEKSSSDLQTTSKKKDILSKEGYFLMYIAAFNGHEKVVRMLLNKGVDPNNCVKEYLSPLHAAAHGGHENIVKLLLDSGASVDEVDSRETYYGDLISTPLLAASYSGSSKIIQLLLDQKANPSAKLKRTKRNFSLPFDIKKYRMCFNKSETRLKKILIQGLYKDSEIKENGSLMGYTALHFAVEAQDEERVKKLTSSGIEINASTKNKATALGLAVEKENMSIVEHLVSCGVDTQASHKWKSIYEVEILKKNVNFAEMLIKCIFSGKHSNEEIYSIGLKIAIENEWEAFFDKWMGTGTFIDNDKKQSLLTSAVRHKNYSFVKKLLEHKDALNITDKDFCTPLSTAVDINETDMVKLLLDSSDKVYSTSAFYSAMQKRNAEIVEMFLKKKLDDENTGKDLFFSAIESSSAEVVQKFLDHGYSIYMKNKEGMVPLISATLEKNVSVVHLLLKKGASLKTTTHKGESALHCTFDMLLSTKVDIMIQLLIDYGADIKEPTRHKKISFPYHKIFTFFQLTNNKSLIELCTLNQIIPRVRETIAHLESALLIKNFEAVKHLILSINNNKLIHGEKMFSFKTATSETLAFFINEKGGIGQTRVKDTGLDDLQYDEFILINNSLDYETTNHLLQCRKIIRLLIQEVARRVCFNEEMEKEIKYFNNSKYIKAYFKRCNEEIELMKITEICTGITYFDVLLADHDRLVSLANNKNVRLVLMPESKVTTMFPAYAELLRGRIGIGSDRRRLFNSSCYLLEKLLRFKFPHLVRKKIFSFLSSKDLINFNTALMNDMFCV